MLSRILSGSRHVVTVSILAIAGCSAEKVDLDAKATPVESVGTERVVVVGDLEGFDVNSSRLFWLENTSELRTWNIWTCRDNDCANTSELLTSSAGLLVGEDNLLWFDRRQEIDSSNSFCRYDLSGDGKVATVFQSTQIQPYMAAQDTGYVYWADHLSGGIYRCPFKGCLSPEFVSYGEAVSLFFVEGEYVYFDYWPSGPNAVYRTLKNGSGETELVLNKTDRPVYDVFATAKHLYWVENSGETPGYSLYRCPLDDCDGHEQLLIEGLNSVEEPHIVRNSLVWIDYVTDVAETRAVSCPLDNCLNNVKTISSAETLHIAVTEKHVYWTTYSRDDESEQELRQTAW